MKKTSEGIRAEEGTPERENDEGSQEGVDP